MLDNYNGILFQYFLSPYNDTVALSCNPELGKAHPNPANIFYTPQMYKYKELKYMAPKSKSLVRCIANQLRSCGKALDVASPDLDKMFYRKFVIHQLPLLANQPLFEHDRVVGDFFRPSSRSNEVDLRVRS